MVEGGGRVEVGTVPEKHVRQEELNCDSLPYLSIRLGSGMRSSGSRLKKGMRKPFWQSENAILPVNIVSSTSYE